MQPSASGCGTWPANTPAPAIAGLGDPPPRGAGRQPQACPPPVAGSQPGHPAGTPPSPPPRRRARPGARPGGAPGHVWTYDFLKDHRENGQALRRLTLVDEFTRECLAIEVGGSLGARRVRAVLERVFAEHGLPEWLRSDNGPGFITLALKAWPAQRGSKPRYIDTGCPWQNSCGGALMGGCGTSA
jgi:transposase InsO family protein